MAVDVIKACRIDTVAMESTGIYRLPIFRVMLHSYGLLKPCFQPENIARTMRNLVRHSDNLIRSASREVLHDCDQKIQEIADRYTATIDTQRAEILRSEKRDTKKNRIDFDI